MPTNSPLREMMLEILQSGIVGLPAIQAAAEVIAEDAALDIRMADAHGKSAREAVAKAAKDYEEEVAFVGTAWSAFRVAVGKEGVFAAGPLEALVRALNDTAQRLRVAK